MKIAKLYKTNDELVEITPKNGTDFTIEELHEHIGCNLIEVLWLNDGKRIMVIDEEGKLDGAQFNYYATIIAENFGAICMPDIIKGNAIICDTDMVR